MRNKFNKNVTKWRMRSVAKWIVNVCLNGWVLLRGFLRGVLLFMFYKKFAAVVLSAVLVGVVPSVVFADADGISAVSDGDVEELSIEDDFSDGADSISAFASALADKTVSEVQGYQEAKAEAEVIAQERLEAEAALRLRVRRKRSVRLLRLRVWRSGGGLWILRCSLWGILMFMVVRV